MKIPVLHTAILVGMLSLSGYAQSTNDISRNTHHEFALDLELEYRYFYQEPLFTNQISHYPSVAFYPKYSVEWNDSYERVNVEGFYRRDIDRQRSHWDIRELYYHKIRNNWELSVGLKKIFWGVTESNHLVDIINQTDAVESFDGEKKLGQPMIHYSLNTNFGVLDLFYLPYHRKRTFAGEKGRFRFPVIITPDDVAYESPSGEWHQDFALRYSNSFNVFDLGLTHFYGTGREPIFIFNERGDISAVYPIIRQTGLDFQVTHDAFLWKLESIYRSSDFQDFFALTAGLEFTIGNIGNSGLDVGLLAEYLYDDRGRWSLNALQNDVFLGSRFAFNDVQDTSILIGGVFDNESSSKVFSLEASRRFGSSFKAALEVRILSDIDPEELILSNFRNDSFLRFSLTKYF